ncbi:hypothetical protein OG203_43705 [Nocardia sp. NBC_01499]|uniref:methyltransferase family protein n=1 Tax=Nocardia sp. NBC_01499 TaxID=2903597 RepID=UPI00386482AD
MIWLSILFPRGRRRYIREDPSTAYQRAAHYQIIPGFSGLFVLQMGPIISAVADLTIIRSASEVGWPLRAIGLAVTLSGVFLVVASVRAIGLASVGFADEYETTPPAHLVRGIYSWLRHPIAFAGTLGSTGLIIALGGNIALAVVNVAVLAIYGPLEDRRLQGVFGEVNASYQRRVRRFVPIRRPEVLLDKRMPGTPA